MIKQTNIIRKVDELGRVALPAEVRRRVGFGELDNLAISIDEKNGRVILKKAYDVCLKCGTMGDLKEIKPGFCICRSCLGALE